MKIKWIQWWQRSQTADQLKSFIKQECENNYMLLSILFYMYKKTMDLSLL